MRNVSTYWSAAAKEAKPYVPGDQPAGAIIKLNTNENPYPPSPKVRLRCGRRSVPSCASIPVQPQMGCGCRAELVRLIAGRSVCGQRLR